MDKVEYILIQIAMIPQEFVYKYNLQEKAHNGYIYARVTKVIYELPQPGQIEYYDLVKYLEPYGYHPSRKTLGLWEHTSQPINFNLVVNDFRVKYSVKEYTLHLKAALEDKCKVTTDCEVK